MYFILRIKQVLDHTFGINSYFEDDFYCVRYLNVCP